MISTRPASADDRSKISKSCKKNVKIVEYHGHILNHHEKFIQISTNMPSIGLVIPEITCEMVELWRRKNTILLSKTNAPCGKW